MSPFDQGGTTGGASSISNGTHAARPAAGTANRLYYETDTLQLYLDNGVTWTLVSVQKLAELVARAHSSLTAIGANDHHNQAHSIIGGDHSSFPGGTTTFLRADGTFAAPAGGGGGDLLAANNLSDLAGPTSTARTNLGLATVAATGSHADLGSVTANQHHAQAHAIDGADHTGTVHTIAQDLNLSGDLSPAQITANQNDYNPASLATATVLRIDLDIARTITGLAGGADGRVLWLANVSGSTLTLSSESASSSAANRFACPNATDVKLPNGSNTLLIYDAVSSRWRVCQSVAFGSSLPPAIGTQSSGTSALSSRTDHVHPTGAGTPSTQAFGDAAAVGTGPAAAMTDHKHGMPSSSGGGATLLKKSADETVNNSATLQNDDDFSFSIAANEVWVVELFLIITSVSVNSDFKAGWTGPAGIGGQWGGAGGLAQPSAANPPGNWGTSGAAASGIASIPFATSAIIGSLNGTYLYSITAIIINAGTAGTINFQWAQGTATAENTKVLQNSIMRRQLA